MLGHDFHLRWPVVHDESYEYRWYFDGTRVPADNEPFAWRDDLQFIRVLPRHEGRWQLEVVNDAGAARSPVLTLVAYDPPPPIVLPPPGTYQDKVTVSITPANPIAGDATAYHYTLDGSLPDQASPRYVGELTLSRTATLRVRGYIGGRALSPVVSQEYVVQPAPIPPTPQDALLLAHWRFDEAGNPRFDDETGWHHLRLSSAGIQRVTDGTAGGALEFDGSSGEGLDAGGFAIPPRGGFTVSAWIRTGSDGASPSGTLWSWASFGLRREPSATDDPRFLGSAGGGRDVAAEAPVADGSWHHVVVACTDDPSNDLRLYLDGQLRGRVLTGSRALAAGSFRIGPGFVGRLDDIQVYNFAVNEAQVASLRAAPGQALEVPRPAPPTPPVIHAITPPGQVIDASGESILFSVQATGSGPLLYQWHRNGVPIESATGPTFLLQGDSGDMVGTYLVDVTGPGGTTRSSPVQVRIPPLAIDAGPFDVVADAGTSLRLSARVTGRLPLAMNWYRNNQALPGATASAYEVASVGPPDAGAYHLVATNPDGSVTSRVAQVVVRADPPTLPGFETQPRSLTTGQELTLKAYVAGARPMSIQWYRDDVPLPGQTEANLVILSARTLDSGQYHLVARNDYGAVTSPRITVVVASGLRPPSIIRQPANRSGTNGQQVSLTLDVTGSGPFEYSWYNNHTGALVGRDANLVVTVSSAIPIQEFYVRVTGPGGSTRSNNVSVSLAPEGTGPPTPELVCYITVPPNTGLYFTEPSHDVLAGSSVSFRIAAGVTPATARIVLFRDGQPIGQVSTASRYHYFTFPDFAPEEAGTYHAEVEFNGIKATSRRVELRSILPPPPVLVQQPVSQQQGTNATVHFQVKASGYGTLKYQWFHDGHALAGATYAVLRLESVRSSDAGEYHVEVSNRGGRVESRRVTLRIVPAPVITGVHIVGSPAAGERLQITVDLVVEGEYRVAWVRNGFYEYSWPSEPSLDLPSAPPGTYTIVVSGAGGTVVRDVVTLPGRLSLDLVSLANGRVLRSPDSGWHDAGSKVVLEAIPDPGFTFLWWLGGHEGDENPTTVVMDRDRKVSALFSPTGGTVYLLNYRSGTDLDARIYDVDGTTRLQGSDFLAQLYAGPVGGELRPMGQPVPFRSGAGAGTLFGDTVLIRTVPAGERADVQIRAWEATAGATYETAISAPGRHGESEILTVVTGNAGEPPTLPAYLTGLRSFQLRPGVLLPPSITRAADPVEVVEGSPARFEVTVTGSGPLTFAWYKDGTPVPGANRARLEWSAVTRADAGLYSVRVTNRLGHVVSPEARLRVFPRTAILAVQAQPTPPVEGSPLTLSVQAEGAEPLAYAWSLDGTAIPGGTGPTLLVPAAEAGSYSVTVSGPGGTASREVARIPKHYPVRITADEGGWIVLDPEGALFREESEVLVQARAQPGYDFAGWEGDLAGAENPRLLVVRGPVTARARYREVGGTLLLANRVADVGLDAPITLASDGTRLAGPEWQVQLFGGPGAASLAAVGSPIGFGSDDGAGYFGPVTRVVPYLSAGTPATVEVRVWEGSAGASFAETASAGGRVGQSATFAARLGNDGFPASPPGALAELKPFTVAPSVAPRLRHAPGDQGAWLGHPAEFRVEVEAHPRPGYQWRKDGQVLPGAQGPTLRLASVAESDAGTYAVQITNERGSVQTSFRLVVGPPARLLAVTGARSLWAGDRAELRVEATAPGPLSFGWFEGEPGNTSRPLGEPSASADWQSQPLLQATRVWVRISDASGHADSDGILLEVRRRPQTLVAELPETLDFGTAPFTPAARSSSGLPTSWVFLAGPATLIDGGLLAVTGVGQILIQFSQPGDERFLPADPLLGAVSVGPRSVRLALEQLEQRADGSPRRVEVRTDPPGVPVVVTYNGSLLPPVEPGSYAVRARVENPNDHGEINGTLVVLPRGWDLLGGVYEDLDGNGQWTANESGLEGVPVRVTGGGLHLVVHTDAEGRFLFPDLPEGVYTVEQLSPEGFALTTLPAQIVAIAPTGFPPRVEFGNQPSDSVGGAVFEDTDGDGQPDPGEPGLGNLAVRLLRPGQPDRTVLAQSDGRYRFDGVSAGLLELRLAVPDTHDATSAAQRSLVLTERGSATVNFGLRPRRTILGLVFEDTDGNGLHDAAEPGLPGVPVHLLRAGSTERVASVLTGERGEFAFPDLPGGNYVLEQELGPGRIAILASGTLALAGPSPDEPARTASRDVLLPQQGSASAVFGNYRTGSLTGLVFADRDGDGRPGAGEPGLGGIHVVLQDADSGATLGSTFSTGQGTYDVHPVPTRRVRVLAGEAPGHAPSQPAVTVQLTARSAAVIHLPYRTLGVVSGRLYIDADRDRSRGAFEPGLGGVRVELVQPGHPPRATTSAGDGSYLFTDLHAGEGRLQLAPVPGFEATTATDASFFVRAGSGFAFTGNFGLAALPIVEEDPYDRWAAAAQLAVQASAPGADPDHDGVVNLLEFLMGTSPTIPNRDGYPRVEVLRPDGAPVLAFLLPRDRTAAEHVRIHLESSGDLLRWEPVDSVASVVTPGATTDLVRLFDPTPPRAPSRVRFLRWVVSRR